MPTKKKPTAKPPNDEPEWAGSGIAPKDWAISDIRDAIEQRDEKQLAASLRESYGVDRDALQLIADLLDPPKVNGLHLKFVQKRRGRPLSEKKLFKRSAIRLKTRFSQRRSQSKFENDVQDTAKSMKISRATVFRALAPRKPKRKIRD